MSDAAQRTILGAIRQHLAAARREPGYVEPVLPAAAAARPALDREAMLAEFAARLAAVGGVAWRVRDAAAAAECVAALAEQLSATRLAASDAPLVAAVLGGLRQKVQHAAGEGAAALAAAELGISSAQAAIAETGSLLLDHRVERHRFVSLLPTTHVALVPLRALVLDLDAALAAVRLGELGPALTLVTGPSRTADIELTLVVGVHGPKALHVVFVDDA